MGKVNLVCSVNEKYLPLINVFLKSIEANSINTFDKIIIRCIGFDPDFSKINLNLPKVKSYILAAIPFHVSVLISF